MSTRLLGSWLTNILKPEHKAIKCAILPSEDDK